ncbi:MAG: gamma subclass chorismate mutase AroQ [Terrimicrobiaceae bacterium]|nr:gamma subclass chorismate mutase AroQ [Terrimicrobiaceae bacterium]
MRTFSPRLWIASAASLILLLGPGCATRSYEPPWNPPQASARLVELMGERLVLAQDAAWAKYREGLPVRDGRREKESLRAAESQARKMGVPASRAKSFLKAQLAASRAVQQDLIAGWKAGRELPARAPKSLERDLRPRMDQINSEMITQLAAAGASSRGRELARQAERYFLALGIPREAALKAVAPLR